MKKVLSSLGFLLLFFALFATDALAKDMSRRFGVGVDSTMSSYADDGRGLSIVYNIHKYFGLQAIVGVSTYNASVKAYDDSETSTSVSITEWNVAIRGIIPIVLSSDVNLGAVVGFSASGRASGGFKSKTEEYAKYNSGYDFSIDLGVRPEWFVTEHFSIHTQVGIGITIITNGGTALNAALSEASGSAMYSTKASGANVDFFKNVDLLGMAGFTFWF